VRAPVERPDTRLAMDFVHDQTASGATFRVLTVIDVYSRECVALAARPQFRGDDVAAALTAVLATRRRPVVIQCDQGTEFTSMALDAWSDGQHIPLDVSRRGTPGDNAVNEAFNGSFRRDCLSQHHFQSVADAQQLIDAWKDEYNNERPHSSLHNLSPLTMERRREQPQSQSSASPNVKLVSGRGVGPERMSQPSSWT